MDKIFLIQTTLLIFLGLILTLIFLILVIQKKGGGISEKFQKDLENSIIEETLKEYQKILYEYQLLFERLKKEFSLFSRKIEESHDRLSKEAESKITELIQRLEKTHSEASNLLLKEAKSKSEELAQSLTKEISNIYRPTQEILKKEVEKTKKEIENYKKERMKELDEKIYLMLGVIAKKTLGRAIDLSDHEELVMEALEKAKKEGIF